MRRIKHNKQVKNMREKKTCIRVILFVVIFSIFDCVCVYGANCFRTPGEKDLQVSIFIRPRLRFGLKTRSRICQTSLLALAAKHTIFKPK